MKKILKFLIHFVSICILTIATQVGGLIYLLTIVLRRVFNLGKFWSVGIFLGAYIIMSFAILPLLAPIFGRSALPLTGNVRPLNFVTCILNRHYVKPQLKQQLEIVANQMNAKYNGTITNYLDANFPFFNGFPLFPHLSHNDGKKLDLAFYYKKNDEPSSYAPSFIGYGVYEAPKNGESDFPSICEQKGYWQYGLLSSIVPQWNKEVFELDADRTKELIKLLAEHAKTSKIFIEPHLKKRWGLSKYDNIRFHGCQAVRHDDHIHTQIK